MPSCTTCGKSPPLVTIKQCAKCSATPYCSRDCQKADWKSHKKLCGKQDASPSTAALSPPKGLDTPVSHPFTRLDNGTWLHGRPEVDVFRLLIDAYRLRMDDEYKFEGAANVDSHYGGGDSVVGFRRFLGSVEKESALLPGWWTAEKKEKCVRFGQSGDAWADLGTAVDKADVNNHYGDSKFAMQLRMFAEAVYGRGPGGSNGTQMRKMLAAMEEGRGPRFTTHLDLAVGV